MSNKGFNRIPFKILALASIVTVIFTLFWMYGTYKLGVPSYFLLFGVLIIIVAIINFIVYTKKAKTTPKSEGELSNHSLNEPTYVYRYCPSCGKAITTSESNICENCLNTK